MTTVVLFFLLLLCQALAHRIHSNLNEIKYMDVEDFVFCVIIIIEFE